MAGDVGRLNRSCMHCGDGHASCRWCQEPVSVGAVSDLAYKLRDHMRGLLAWYQVHAPRLRAAAEADHTWLGRAQAL